MHLNDAFGKHPDLKYICCHHEQACAMAAESYFRSCGKMAIVNVTTGPGVTNAITGVYGAYVDSMAMIVISGQVKRETLLSRCTLPVRQLGDQEIDVIPMVRGITKYAVLISDPSTIRYHLEEALHLATHGRPGPVWLDIPVDVQSALINPEDLQGFNIPAEPISTEVVAQRDQMLRQLRASQRPVIMLGTGVRLSQTQSEILEWARFLKIPLATTWNSHDLVPDDHPCYVGRPGSLGDRSGNFAVQNSDFLLILGSRLNIRQISYNWQSFARKAYKVMVDVDPAELQKPTLKIDLPICSDLKKFFYGIGVPETQTAHAEFLGWCLERRRKYDVVLPNYWEQRSKVNPYCFTRALFDQLKEGEHIVTGDGTACVVTFQAAKIKKNQRLYTNSGCASMGYDLPAAIGACIASRRERVICIAGDGSIQMNLQELQTISFHKMPIKIFVLNNGGYLSIRQTQQNFFKDNIVGCGPESGVGFANFEKIADAFSIPYFKIPDHSKLGSTIEDFLSSSGSGLCEVMVDLAQPFAPKVTSRKMILTFF